MSPRSATYRADTQYGIGLTANDIIHIRDFGLVVPRVIYRPFQAVYSRGDITREGDGPISVEWIWDIVYLERVGSLIRYLFGAETSQYAHNRFVRTDKRVGWYGRPSRAFATFSTTVWRPLLFGPDGSYAEDTPYQVDTLRLIFKNMVEQT